MSTNLPGAAGLPSQNWAVGLDASGLEHCPGIGLAHPSAAAALQRLQSRARRAGMALECDHLETIALTEHLTGFNNLIGR